ncbi:MAG: hypothetical protein B7Z80_00955 [Rhodospirillales bacterium 20-64-7]|nr:MAG: hypothetical protein B7Z80_00955 [Rhodospirillales bacterium 20-64-7]
MEEKKVWEFVRRQLKTQRGWRIYYNRIPMILSELKVIPFIQKNARNKYQEILNDFIRINNAWEKVTTERKYFINLRYVCLRLMHYRKVYHPYEIPLLRTSRKKVALDLIFDQLLDQAMEDELEEFLQEEFDLD